MVSVYEECPKYESRNYLLRFVDAKDAADLLDVYSDEKAVPYFNSDNCGGDDFHYTTLERMQEAIAYWQWEYERQGFVRWSIVEKAAQQVVGTIELFHRLSEDAFNHYGILRLDLRSDREQEESIFEITQLIKQFVFDAFDCEAIATKIPPFAVERKKAMEKLGFTMSKEKLIGGHDGKAYSDYYVLPVLDIFQG